MLTSDEIEAIESQIRRIRPVRALRLPVVGLGFVAGMFLFYGLIHRESQYVAVAGIFLVASAGVFAVVATANGLKKSIERLLAERAERERPSEGGARRE